MKRLFVCLFCGSTRSAQYLRVYGVFKEKNKKVEVVCVFLAARGQTISVPTSSVTNSLS